MTKESSTPGDANDSPAAIENDIPGWHIWRPRNRDGHPSSWAASRRDESAGIEPTVIRNTPEEMRAALAEQRDLAERAGRPPMAIQLFPGNTP